MLTSKKLRSNKEIKKIVKNNKILAGINGCLRDDILNDKFFFICSLLISL